MNAPVKEPPTAQELQEKVAVLEVSLQVVTAQRNNLANENAALQVQLQFAEQRIKILSQLRTNQDQKPKIVPVENPENKEEGAA